MKATEKTSPTETNFSICADSKLEKDTNSLNHKNIVTLHISLIFHKQLHVRTPASNCFLHCLKLLSAIFYQFFIFSPNDSPLKIMKNVLYFIEKALFILEILKFLWFFPFLSTLSRFKTTNGSGKIYDVMNWLA